MEYSWPRQLSGAWKPSTFDQDGQLAQDAMARKLGVCSAPPPCRAGANSGTGSANSSRDLEVALALARADGWRASLTLRGFAGFHKSFLRNVSRVVRMCVRVRR